MVYMNLEGKWSLTTPLMGLGLARSYYENFCQSSQHLSNKKITGNPFQKLITSIIYTYKFLLVATIFLPPVGP